jgi:ATP-binding cassette subfamily B protein
VQLGLDAEQVLLPVDHLLLPETRALPAIVVVRLGNGLTHFVVAWRRHGRLLQVMDPATGRRWPTCQRFLDDLYVHTMLLPAAAWRDWAGTPEFCGTLRQRWDTLGLTGAVTELPLAAALAAPDWYPLALLDAATRMVAAIVRAGGLGGKQQTPGVFAAFCERARQEGAATTRTIPEAYWMVRPASPGPDGAAQMRVRGAVLVRVRGRCQAHRAWCDEKPSVHTSRCGPLSPELLAILTQPPRPERELLRLLRQDGLLAPTVLLAALLLSAVSAVVEALLCRDLFELSRDLGLVEQRLGAMAALCVFMAALLLLELPTMTGLLHL